MLILAWLLRFLFARLWYRILNQSTPKVQDFARGSRVLEERHRLGMTQPQLADAGGVSKGSQILYEKGNPPTADYLAAVAEVGVDVHYVLTGRRLEDELQARMHGGLTMAEHAAVLDRIGFRGFGRRILTEAGLLPAPPAIPARGESEDVDYVAIPRATLDVSAGNGLGPAEDGQGEGILIPQGWMDRERLVPGRCVMVRVNGDSMSPGIAHGAFILVNTPERDLRAPGIYAMTLDGEALVKRLSVGTLAPDGRPTSVLLVSDNPAYPPRVLGGDQLAALTIVGRVRGVFAFL
jgi:transcriptional regulator with XRE-family HTH domain